MGVFDRIATDGTARVAADGTVRIVAGGIDGGVDVGVYTITGAPATFKIVRVMLASPGVYTINGDSAALLDIPPTFTMDAAPGSYSITGVPPQLSTIIVASLASGVPRIAVDGTTRVATDGTVRVVVGAGIIVPGGNNIGSYAITGFDPALIANLKLNADPGAYTITGSDATLNWQHVMHAAVGSYSISGSDASVAIKMPVTPGIYSITGHDARGVIRTPLAAGSYSINGVDIGVEYRIVTTGAYTITGLPATLIRIERMGVAVGSYSIDGAEASASYRMATAPGSYSINGDTAALDVIGPVLIGGPAASGSYSINGEPADLIVIPAPENNPEVGRGGGSAPKEIPPHEWEVDLFRAKEYRRNFDMAVPPVAIAQVALGSIASPPPRPASVPLPPFVKPR